MRLWGTCVIHEERGRSNGRMREEKIADVEIQIEGNTPDE